MTRYHSTATGEANKSDEYASVTFGGDPHVSSAIQLSVTWPTKEKIIQSAMGVADLQSY